jgi:hypothetical protein
MNDSTPTLCGWTAEVEVGRAGGCGVGTWYHVLGQVRSYYCLAAWRQDQVSNRSVARLDAGATGMGYQDIFLCCSAS